MSLHVLNRLRRVTLGRARRTGAGLVTGLVIASLVLSAVTASAAPGGAAGVARVEPRVAYAPTAPDGTRVLTTSGRVDATRLTDGDIAAGRAGGTWTPASWDTAPRVRLRWPSPRTITSVVVLGAEQPESGPKSSTSAPLHGTLRFDDGSEVPVSGIAGGRNDATVVAFPPERTATVTLRLERTLPQAVLGLREFAAYGQGTTPPRWPVQGARTYEVSAPADSSSSCPTSAPPGGPRLALACPSMGAAVDGTARLTLSAPTAVGQTVEASTWVPSSPGAGSVAVVATAVVGGDGLARLTFPTTVLPRGPVGVHVRFRSGGDVVPVQLYNRTGVPQDTSGHAPPGMTLQWDEDFRAPLSISQRGVDAVYAAAKPEPWGWSEFGDAVFVDPAAGDQALATLEREYLRIRVAPLGGRPDPGGWGRRHTGGLLSSAQVGGSGFAAQYGYFEARMLAPGGRGSWPAFWMLDSEAATERQGKVAEVDAVELYGHDTRGSCHTIHNWNAGQDSPEPACLSPNGASDWSMSWHTYGVQVRPGGADFYVDGRLVAKRDGMVNSDQPFFFMMDLALGGGWPVDLRSTGDTVDLYVDWIRVHT